MLRYTKVVKTRRESGGVVEYISDILLEIPNKFQVKFSTSEHLELNIKAVLSSVVNKIKINDVIIVKTPDTEFSVTHMNDIVTFTVKWFSFRSEVDGNYMTYTAIVDDCLPAFIGILDDMKIFRF
jgi:hypothetical protein